MTNEEATLLWKKVLNINLIDKEKTFFEHGGNSLQAMTLLQLAEEEYHCSIDLMYFFENGTIESMINSECDEK